MEEFVARSRKEAPKPTLEERMLDLWNQNVFLVRRHFPHAEKRISAIQKKHHKAQDDFLPSEDAVTELTKLYAELRTPGARA